MGLTNKICSVLLKYPSTERLHKATIAGLSKIPFITESDAQELKSDAQKTVVSLNGPIAEQHMTTLVEAHNMEKTLLNKQWEILTEQYCDRVDYHRLRSVTGIGKKTAISHSC